MVQAAKALIADCDLVLVLGSSMRVVTCEAFDDVLLNSGHLVVCNLQLTPYDKAASLRTFADCDDLMARLMATMGVASLPPPPFGGSNW